MSTWLPFLVLRADRRRAVDLGQAVDVRQVEADALHALDHRRRRRRRRDHAAHLVRDALLHLVRRVDQRGVNDRSAAVVRDLMFLDQIENFGSINLAQADIRARVGGHGPGESPAVAVEHRQRPQVHRVLRHAPGDDVADGVQVRAAVVVDDALGVAGRARGVVQRDGVPLVLRPQPGELRVALLQQRLVAGLGVDDGNGRICLLDDRRDTRGRRSGAWPRRASA